MSVVGQVRLNFRSQEKLSLAASAANTRRWPVSEIDGPLPVRAAEPGPGGCAAWGSGKLETWEPGVPAVAPPLGAARQVLRFPGVQDPGGPPRRFGRRHARLGRGPDLCARQLVDEVRVLGPRFGFARRSARVRFGRPLCKPLTQIGISNGM